MNRILFIIILIVLSLFSCDQSEQEVMVTYLVTDSDSGFDIRYTDTTGNVVYEKIQTNSETDVWKHSFSANRGAILFISANYFDVNSKIKVRIMLDGKLFREASSRYDTANFVVVSGTVPY